MMDARTRLQEQRYNQALGYGWGRKDATPYASDSARQDHTADVFSFATFYSMLPELAGHDRLLEDAWEYFRQLNLEEQKSYGTEWMRSPYVG